MTSANGNGKPAVCGGAQTLNTGPPTVGELRRAGFGPRPVRIGGVRRTTGLARRSCCGRRLSRLCSLRSRHRKRTMERCLAPLRCHSCLRSTSLQAHPPPPNRPPKSVEQDRAGRWHVKARILQPPALGPLGTWDLPSLHRHFSVVPTPAPITSRSPAKHPHELAGASTWICIPHQTPSPSSRMTASE